ncbi:MAG: biopolymer transporter ExbD [candidate division KSB1 bacterium]|jgi:biopolymer transport protein ExbD|nr:biopolymer transporter ExbD [candidate division KSB1 bacterium]
MLKRKKSREAEIPTSSLADIAFLLLIFFLVTTTIDVDKGIGLVLPAKGETKAVRSQNITNLLINAQGEVLLDDNPIDVNLVKNVIQKKITEKPNLIVSVKTDQDTQYWVYIKVLDQLKQANASRISIAEPER